MAQQTQTQTIEYDGYTFDRDVLRQLSTVRETGATNMFIARNVAYIADQFGYDALADFCDDVTSDRQNGGARYIAALEAMAEHIDDGGSR